MYHIIDTSFDLNIDTNEIAIVNVFEEFIGCAVSTLIASLIVYSRYLHFSAIILAMF
jgi:hypothetical protein